MIVVNYQILEEKPETVNQYQLKYPFSCKVVGLDRKTLFPIAIDLKPAGSFSFKLGRLYCPTCLHQVKGDVCSVCSRLDWREELPVRIRVLCNYRDPDSPLLQAGYCTYADYPCGFVENRDVCHGTYFLYIGRFNTLFKVGISRIGRTKKKRLIEQGLNEAYVLSPIPNLPKALKLEQLISETLMIPDRLHRSQKVESFLSKEVWDWKKIHDFLDGIRHLFKMEHFQIQKDFRVSSLEPIHLEEGLSISGLVLWIQGPWLIFLDDNEHTKILNLKELEGYELGGI